MQLRNLERERAGGERGREREREREGWKWLFNLKCNILVTYLPSNEPTATSEKNIRVQ